MKNKFLLLLIFSSMIIPTRLIPMKLDSSGPMKKNGNIELEGPGKNIVLKEAQIFEKKEAKDENEKTNFLKNILLNTYPLLTTVSSEFIDKAQARLWPGIKNFVVDKMIPNLIDKLMQWDGAKGIGYYMAVKELVEMMNYLNEPSSSNLQSKILDLTEDKLIMLSGQMAASDYLMLTKEITNNLAKLKQLIKKGWKFPVKFVKGKIEKDMTVDWKLSRNAWLEEKILHFKEITQKLHKLLIGNPSNQLIIDILNLLEILQ